MFFVVLIADMLFWIMFLVCVLVGAILTVFLVEYFNAVKYKWLSVAGVGFSVMGFGWGMTLFATEVVIPLYGRLFMPLW